MPEEFSSLPKVIFITGASSGIGYATALAFARRGDHVAGTARRADKLAMLAAEINALPAGHGEFLPLTADVRDAQAVHEAVAQTVARFGRLDVLVANAGIGHRGAFTEAALTDLEALLRTNLDGVIHSIQAGVPVMRGHGGGQIVFISSIMSNMTVPYAATYAASKAFVTSLANSLRLELAADHITVTDMLIGRTETEFDQKRLGKGERTRSGGPAKMSAEIVAAGIVRAVDQKRARVALRWIDRLILLANWLVPGLVGRIAMRQYQ
jgi:short-subunit dehydrogenase